jgi:hypothetical protein
MSRRATVDASAGQAGCDGGGANGGVEASWCAPGPRCGRVGKCWSDGAERVKVQEAVGSGVNRC